ncbi:MAG: sodium:solute symporter family protein [Pseudomonadota bacterium]
MDIFSLSVFVSMFIFFAIGNFAGRTVKDADDYFVAGRRAPTILILGTLVASVFSSTIFLGEAGFTYDGQMGPYMLFPGITTAGYIYGALLFGRYLRRSRAPTVAEFFGQRFNSRRVQQLSGAIIICALSIYLLVVTQGGALLLSDLTGLSYSQSLITAWLAYTLFTIYSGSKGVILTDTLMFILFAVATVVFSVVIISDLGGVSTAIERMAQIESKPEIASWHGIVGEGTEWATPIDYLIWAITIDMAWSVVYAVSPWQSSRHLMARNEHVVIRASIYTALAVILLQALIYGVGGLINLYNPNITPSETAMIWAAKNLVPDYLGAILLAGIMAAALSSASTFLSLVGFSASNDVLSRPQPLNLRTTRVLTLVVGAIALVTSFFFPPNIFWLMLFVGTVFTSSWGPVAFMSVWSKRITADAAFWGMATGFLFNVVPSGLEYIGIIDLPHYFSATIIGVTASLVTIVMVSRAGEVTAAETAFRLRLHETPAEDRDATKARTTMIAAFALVAYGLTMPFLTLRFYVLPYQRGAGELAADGGINWQTGEALLALTSPLIYVPLGLYGAYLIWRGYHPRAAKPQAQNPVLSEELSSEKT